MKPEKYILRPIVFTAVKWMPDTDHPKVTVGEGRRRAGWNKCESCGEKERLHGELVNGDGDTVRVCPGMYVVDHPNGTTYACEAADFEKTAVALTEAAQQIAGLS